MVKWLLFGFIGAATFYIGILVDLLCPLWDRNKQTLHEKVVETYVVEAQRKRDVAVTRPGGELDARAG